MWRVPPTSGSRDFSRASASPDFPPVEVRLVRSLEELAACEAMSREIWGAAERNVVPRELLLTMQKNGGLVHGAFLPEGRLVGFCFGFLGMRDGQLRLCSHQLGVLPEFRGTGIGIALKQAQRYDALRQGYELVTWTFDPLEARNAYINLHRLGCIARLYDRDHYGPMEDELNRGLPSDRFEAEWWLLRPKPSSTAGDPVMILRVGADGIDRRAAGFPGSQGHESGAGLTVADGEPGGIRGCPDRRAHCRRLPPRGDLRDGAGSMKIDVGASPHPSRARGLAPCDRRFTAMRAFER
jgi:predicted GNAT superfamily acetyltransferase